MNVKMDPQFAPPQLSADNKLHTVQQTDGLSQDNPNRAPEAQEKVRRGQEAMERSRRGWEDWLKIGEALDVGRSEVTRRVGTNEPVGRRYEKAMGDWLVENGFKEIDKGTRSRLLDCLEHLAEIEAWRNTLTAGERFRLNHPNAVWRRWKANTTVPDPNRIPKPSPWAKLKDEQVRLSKENYVLRREVERAGGDLESVLGTVDGGATITSDREQNHHDHEQPLSPEALEICRRAVELVWNEARCEAAPAARRLKVRADHFRRLVKQLGLKRPWND